MSVIQSQTLSGSPICREADPCAYISISNYNASDPLAICGDSRLGPVVVPSTVPLLSDLSSLTSSYDRFGGLCPDEYLDKWYNPTCAYRNGDGDCRPGYIYPEQDGFLLDDMNMAINASYTLVPGTLIDRFGGEDSRDSFFSPYGSPYEQRSLPVRLSLIVDWS